MEVGPGRKAGRADIADQLPGADVIADMGDDPAHMGIAGAHVAGVADLDVIAVAAMPAGIAHHAVGGGHDRRSHRRAIIDALVHAAVTQDRVEAHAEAGGLVRALDRHLHLAALLAGAGGVEPLLAPVIGPFEQSERLLALLQPGQQQAAGLGLAGRGAAMLHDQVEAIVATDRADRDMLRHRTQIGVDRFGRRAGGPRGGRQARSHPAGDAQRRIVDRDRDLLELELAVDPVELQRELELGAEGEMIERARDALVGAAAERDVELGTGLDVAEPHGIGHHVRNLVGFVAADAGAGQRAGEAVAAAQGSGQADLRALGRVGEPFDQRGRRGLLAGVGAERGRRDRRDAHLAGLGIAQGCGNRADQCMEARCHRDRRGAERGAGGEPAPPFAAADPRTEIDDQVDRRGMVGAAIEWGAIDQAGLAGRCQRDRATALGESPCFTQIHRIPWSGSRNADLTVGAAR